MRKIFGLVLIMALFSLVFVGCADSNSDSGFVITTTNESKGLIITNDPIAKSISIKTPYMLSGVIRSHEEWERLIEDLIFTTLPSGSFIYECDIGYSLGYIKVDFRREPPPGSFIRYTPNPKLLKKEAQEFFQDELPEEVLITGSSFVFSF
jgi:hypothetical protein